MCRSGGKSPSFVMLTERPPEWLKRARRCHSLH
jgi:hypothetical protein